MTAEEFLRELAVRIIELEDVAGTHLFLDYMSSLVEGNREADYLAVHMLCTYFQEEQQDRAFRDEFDGITTDLFSKEELNQIESGEG